MAPGNDIHSSSSRHDQKIIKTSSIQHACSTRCVITCGDIHTELSGAFNPAHPPCASTPVRQENVKRERHERSNAYMDEETCANYFLDLYHTSGKFRLVMRQRPRPTGKRLGRPPRGNDCTTNPRPLVREGGREKWQRAWTQSRLESKMAREKRFSLKNYPPPSTMLARLGVS